jgi:hypothetical protein
VNDPAGQDLLRDYPSCVFPFLLFLLFVFGTTNVAPQGDLMSLHRDRGLNGPPRQARTGATYFSRKGYTALQSRVASISNIAILDVPRGSIVNPAFIHT